MRRSILDIFLFLLVIISTAACNNDLPFDLKENPPKLVMNAIINADSTYNTLFLNLTGRNQIGQIKGATVEVRINGSLSETLRPDPHSSDKGRFYINSAFHPGDVVRIDAMTDDGEHHAWAEVTVPQPIGKIEKVDTASIMRKPSNYGYGTPPRRHLRYQIKIKDRPGEKNFYRIIVEQRKYWKYYWEQNDQTCWDSAMQKSFKLQTNEDVVLTDGKPSTEEDDENGLFGTVNNKYAIFDDSRFTDGSYTMNVYNDIYGWGFWGQEYIWIKTDVYIRILSITEKEYYYLRALNLLDSDAYDNTLSEPIAFPSNVNGGTGMVGFSTETNYMLTVKNNAVPPNGTGFIKKPLSLCPKSTFICLQLSESCSRACYWVTCYVAKGSRGYIKSSHY